MNHHTKTSRYATPPLPSLNHHHHRRSPPPSGPAGDGGSACIIVGAWLWMFWHLAQGVSVHSAQFNVVWIALAFRSVPGAQRVFVAGECKQRPGVMLTSELSRVVEFRTSEGISTAKASHGQSQSLTRWGNGPCANKGTREHALFHLFRSRAPPRRGIIKESLVIWLSLFFFSTFSWGHSVGSDWNLSEWNGTERSQWNGVRNEQEVRR